jgi:hypothetical protein
MVPEELHLLQIDRTMPVSWGGRSTLFVTKTLRDELENYRQIEVRKAQSRSNRKRFQGIRNGHLTRRARKLSCSDGRAQNLTPRTRCKDSSKDRYKRFSSTDHRQGAQAISSNYQRSVRRTSPFEQEMVAMKPLRFEFLSNVQTDNSVQLQACEQRLSNKRRGTAFHRVAMND